MGKYILKRIVYIVLVFFLLSFLIFMVYGMLPVDKAAEAARAEITGNKNLNYNERYEYWSAQYGTDGTKLEQYGRWLGVYPYSDGTIHGIFTGDLGTSRQSGNPVSAEIVEPMKNTVFINIFSTVLALGITIPLGIFCAVKRGSKRDVGVQVGTLIGYSLPTFIIAIVFIWIFSVSMDIFPVSGMQTAGYLEWSKWDQFWDKMYHLALPLIVMTFTSLGGMTRYVRAAMIEALSMDYVRTARAKGLREKIVIYSHAWRNALLPVVTLIIGWFIGIFGGSVMIENIFSLNGMGKLYFDALNANDNEIILAVQMFYIAISLFGNLFIDLVYGLVDPRVRVNK